MVPAIEQRNSCLNASKQVGYRLVSPTDYKSMRTRWVNSDEQKWVRSCERCYLADLIVVDGNPLLDLSIFQDRNSFLAIMKDGSFHKPFQGRVAADQRVAAE
jgi:hypothetical protein